MKKFRNDPMKFFKALSPNMKIPQWQQDLLDFIAKNPRVRLVIPLRRGGRRC